MPPECMKCLDRGIIESPFGATYCDCKAGREAEETDCLRDEDANEQPQDFGDQ